jgi:hypothetical protein
VRDLASFDRSENPTKYVRDQLGTRTRPLCVIGGQPEGLRHALMQLGTCQRRRGRASSWVVPTYRVMAVIPFDWAMSCQDCRSVNFSLWAARWRTSLRVIVICVHRHFLGFLENRQGADQLSMPASGE